MNKTVVGWSAGLLVLGVPLVFLPAPVPWLAPLPFVAAWLLLLRRPPVPVVLPPPPPEVTREVVVEVRETVPGTLLADLQRFRASLEILGGLKNLVVDDTESAAVRLTEALFNLVENSKEVSAHIEKSLAFISDGDSGLGKTVGNLEAQVRVFETLAQRFSEVKQGLQADIAALTKAVGNINQFSGTLSDLADQTNVLAINASIEAARVGVHGRGFAVIANHVQMLARNSKEISDKMALTVREVVASVERSFDGQTRRITESEGLILTSESELRRWSDRVAPQVAEVQSMISDTRRLASVVTAELGEVTVSLQFQDRTRQILDHMAEILREDSDKMALSAGLPAGEIPLDAQKAAFDAASRHFTVQEEWALGPEGRGAARTKAVELF